MIKKFYKELDTKIPIIGVGGVKAPTSGIVVSGNISVGDIVANQSLIILTMTNAISILIGHLVYIIYQ